MDNFSGLNGFEREKNVDKGFGIIAGKGLMFKVNYARIEANDGKYNDELKGVDFLKYELETEGGRKLWGSFNLDNEDKQRKLANIFYTVGLEFNNKDELLEACEKFVELTVGVSAWGWAPDKEDIDPTTDKPKVIQLHKITGIVDDSEKDEGSNKTEF